MRELNESFFDEIQTEKQAYWLGFLAADGGVYKGNIRLSLEESDRAHVEKFKLAVGSDAPIKRLEFSNAWKTRPQACLALRRKKMAEGLARHGVVPRKTTEGWVPKLPRDLERHYWRGVFDGDGYVSRFAKRNEWGVGLCGNLATMQEFVDFLKRNLDYSPTIHPIKRRGGGAAVCFRVVVSGRQKPAAILSLLYRGAARSCLLDRKANKAQELLGNLCREDA